MPSSITRNSWEPKTKIFFEIRQGILEGRTNRAWPYRPCLKNCQNGTFRVLSFSVLSCKIPVFSTSQITHYCVILAQLKYKAASCSQWHAWPSAEGPKPQKGKGSNRNFVFVETLISLSFNTPMSNHLGTCSVAHVIVE